MRPCKLDSIVRIGIISLLALCSGCIRLVGTAGYSKFKKDEVQTKQIGFDTDTVVHPNRAPGNIQMGEES